MTLWEEVPDAAGFKTQRLGGRGDRHRATIDDQAEQRREYTKFVKWASLCGVREEEFQRILKGIPSDQNERGRANLSQCLWERKTTSRRHAILECQEVALRKVAEEVGRSVGGEELAEAALEQLGELLSSESARLSLFVQAPLHWCGKGGLNLPPESWKIGAGIACVPGLFEVWLRQSGAALMGPSATERWRKVSAAALAEVAARAPSQFSLDGAIVGSLGTEQSYSHDQVVRPTRVAWKAFAWEAASAEVRDRFDHKHELRFSVAPKGEIDNPASTGHAVDQAQCIRLTMSQLYERLHTVPTKVGDVDQWRHELVALHGTWTCPAKLCSVFTIMPPARFYMTHEPDECKE